MGTAQEIDAAALDSVTTVLSRRPRRALPVGAPCPNCESTLAGPWCHACGQSAEDYHRSLVRLSAEAINGLFDLDGRIWRTLPDLCFRPARLTRRFLDGHRVSQVPPFRLFLIVVVLVFLAAGIAPQADKTTLQLSGQGGAVKTDTGLNLNVVPKGHDPFATWVTTRLRQAAKNPQSFESTLTAWAQRLAVLTLPLSAAMLGLMFFWRRGIYMFDHLIFSMHSLSFQGFLLTTTIVASMISDWFQLLILAAPVHLFFHLKGAYGLGVVGTLVRMLALLVGSLFAFVLALAGLVLIGLAEIGG